MKSFLASLMTLLLLLSVLTSCGGNSPVTPGTTDDIGGLSDSTESESIPETEVPGTSPDEHQQDPDATVQWETLIPRSCSDCFVENGQTWDRLYRNSLLDGNIPEGLRFFDIDGERAMVVSSSFGTGCVFDGSQLSDPKKYTGANFLAADGASLGATYVGGRGRIVIPIPRSFFGLFRFDLSTCELTEFIDCGSAEEYTLAQAMMGNTLVDGEKLYYTLKLPKEAGQEGNVSALRVANLRTKEIRELFAVEDEELRGLHFFEGKLCFSSDSAVYWIQDDSQLCKLEPNNGQIICSFAISGDVICVTLREDVYHVEGLVSAYRMDGTLLWSDSSEEKRLRNPFEGWYETPTVFNGKIIAYNTQKDVYLLDPVTGEYEETSIALGVDEYTSSPSFAVFRGKLYFWRGDSLYEIGSDLTAWEIIPKQSRMDP